MVGVHPPQRTVRPLTTSSGGLTGRAVRFKWSSGPVRARWHSPRCCLFVPVRYDTYVPTGAAAGRSAASLPLPEDVPPV